MRKLVAPLVAVVAVAVAVVGPGVAPVSPAGAQAPPVATTYGQTGAWATASTVVTGPHDPYCAFDTTPNPPADVQYQIYYPSGLGWAGIDHPVVTFGVGTCGTPYDYAGLLEHLASWGFVVIAANSGDNGGGEEILDAAEYVVAQNANPSSPFFGRIDTANVAAVGHSQGAGGAVNATTDSGGLITSTVALNLPDPFWVTGPGDAFDVSALDHPVLFATGSTDILTLAQADYYDDVPGAAARGRLVGVGHTWPADGGGFRGYVTAWLTYTLLGDAGAAPAWVGPGAQFLTDPAWDQRAIKP